MTNRKDVGLITMNESNKRNLVHTMIQCFATKSEKLWRFRKTDNNKGNRVRIINWICIRQEARSCEIDRRNDKYHRHTFLCNFMFENCLSITLERSNSSQWQASKFSFVQIAKKLHNSSFCKINVDFCWVSKTTTRNLGERYKSGKSLISDNF